MEYSIRADNFIKDYERRMSMQDCDQENYLKELAQKAKVKDEELERDLERLKDANRLEKELRDLDEKYAQAKKVLADTSELEALQDKYDEERRNIQNDAAIERKAAEHKELMRQKRAEMEANLDVEKLNNEISQIKLEAEKQRIQLWLEQQRSALQIKADDKRTLTEIYKGQDIMTLIAMANSAAEREQLIEAFKLQRQGEMTPEQILASGAANGHSSAAEAMKAILGDKEMYERLLAQMREDYARTLERDERIFSKGFEASLDSTSPRNSK